MELLQQLVRIMAFNVNGQIISDEDIYSEFESIKDHYTRLGEVVCCDRDEEFMTYARDNVVNRALMEQESLARFGDLPEEQVDARMDQLQSEHGGEKEFYEETGLDPEEGPKIRQRIRSGLIVDRLLEELVGNLAEPTEMELRSYYEANLDRYMSEERIRVSQIFIEPTSHEAAREAFVNLRKIREELLDGADFDEIARKHSNREKVEIDLGFMRQGETMPEIEAITFSLRTGEISPIVATHFGFHIFKVTERELPAPIPFEELEDLTEHYKNDQRETTINDFIEGLKEKGSVEELEPQEQSA